MSAIQRGTLSTAGSVAGGVALLGVAAAWWAVSGVEAGATLAWPVGLWLAAAAALAGAWALAARRPSLAPAALLGAAAAIFAAEAGATFRSGPQQGPFGYANATAAFAAQVFVAALLLVVVARGALRVVGGLAAAAVTPILFLTGSATVLIALPLLVVAALVVERLRSGRAAVAVCGGLFVAALVATLVLGAMGIRTGNDAVDRLVGSTISEERVALWNEALSIAAEHPLLGVGPGRFARTSAIALADSDLRWAHNEFLQAGAETGLFGYVLVIGVFLWGFAALAQGSPGRAAALSAAGLSVLGIQASVDYVLHFPFVVLMAAGVLGAGLGAERAPVGVPLVPSLEPVGDPA